MLKEELKVQQCDHSEQTDGSGRRLNREIKEVVKLLAEIDKICKREGVTHV